MLIASAYRRKTWYTFIPRLPQNLVRLSGTFLHRYLESAEYEEICKDSGIDPANLSHVLSGKRKLTALMLSKLEPLLGDTQTSRLL